MYVARARLCTQSVHGRGRPCTDCTRPPSAAYEYKLCIRPYTGHAHGTSVSRTRPCSQPVRGKTRPGTRPVPGRVRTVYTAVHGPCTVYTAVYTAVFTARLHGRVRTMYRAVHRPSMTRTRPCTRSCTLYTAVFTARAVYTAVHGVYGPCTPRHGAFQLGIAKVDNRNLLDGYYAKPIIRSQGNGLFTFSVAVTF